MQLKINFTFDPAIKTGAYSAAYFLKSTKILASVYPELTSWIRWAHFSRKAMVCGVTECLQLIAFLLPADLLKKMAIYYHEDGTILTQKTPVIAIRGKYKDYAILENLINGILARRSAIANNVAECLQALQNNPNRLIYMHDRSDDYLLQPYDGYSAYVGGVRKFVTAKQVAFLNAYQDHEVLGTIPHALIQQFGGDLVKTMQAYQHFFPNQKTTALIDFHNNCLQEIHHLKANNIPLDFVRIDTAKSLVDVALQKQAKKGNPAKYKGVSVALVKKVRKALDQMGYEHTKIIVSSGFDLAKIKLFEKQKAPVDVYGVGKSLGAINLNFTADLIMRENKPLAKTGRIQNLDKYLPTMKLLKLE